MRAVVWFLGMALLLCCDEAPEGGIKFAVQRKADAFYYAQYTFTHSDYESVTVAVRIQHSGSVLKNMDVKDLTNTANPIESMALSATSVSSRYKGETEGEHGGKYRVYTMGSSCCGMIRFTPSADTSASFIGVRDKELTQEEWESLTSSPSAEGYFYAKYRFTHDDYDNVDTAVRIKTNLSSMDVKDLTSTANPPAESMNLEKENDDYVGTVTGANGGEYRVVKLNDVCCGDITFTLASDATVTFVGKKIEDLTATQWATLNPPDSDSGALSPSALGTVQVGKLFSINATEGTADVTMSLEAHNDGDGTKVDKALAHWVAVGENAYNVQKMLSAGSGRFDVFLTEAALNSVEMLVGLVAGEKKGKVTITPASSSAANKLSISNGDVMYSFSANEAAPEVMIVDATGNVVQAGSTTRISSTNNLRIGRMLVGCNSGETAFAKTTTTIYQASCP